MTQFRIKLDEAKDMQSRSYLQDKYNDKRIPAVDKFIYQNGLFYLIEKEKLEKEAKEN